MNFFVLLLLLLFSQPPTLYTYTLKAIVLDLRAYQQLVYFYGICLFARLTTCCFTAYYKLLVRLFISELRLFIS